MYGLYRCVRVWVHTILKKGGGRKLVVIVGERRKQKKRVGNHVIITKEIKANEEVLAKYVGMKKS